MNLLSFNWHVLDDVRISRIGDGQWANTEIFTACSAQFDIVARIMVNTGFGHHSVVFDFRFAEWWSVVWDDHQLGFALQITKFIISLLFYLKHVWNEKKKIWKTYQTKWLQSLFITEVIFAGLHDESQARVDALHGLFRLLISWCHCDFWEKLKKQYKNLNLETWNDKKISKQR